VAGSFLFYEMRFLNMLAHTWVLRITRRLICMIDILGRRILNKNLYELVGFRQCFFSLICAYTFLFFIKALVQFFDDWISF